MPSIVATTVTSQSGGIMWLAIEKTISYESTLITLSSCPREGIVQYCGIQIGSCFLCAISLVAPNPCATLKTEGGYLMIHFRFHSCIPVSSFRLQSLRLKLLLCSHIVRVLRPKYCTACGKCRVRPGNSYIDFIFPIPIRPELQ